MKEQFEEWTLIPSGNGLYILKVEDEKEGVDEMWITEEQLESLKNFLNARS